jgi:hypothetical protein
MVCRSQCWFHGGPPSYEFVPRHHFIQSVRTSEESVRCCFVCWKLEDQVFSLGLILASVVDTILHMLPVQRSILLPHTGVRQQCRPLLVLPLVLQAAVGDELPSNSSVLVTNTRPQVCQLLTQISLICLLGDVNRCSEECGASLSAPLRLNPLLTATGECFRAGTSDARTGLNFLLCSIACCLNYNCSTACPILLDATARHP